MVPFTLETPEYDMTTYYGRFNSFRKTQNPFYAFYTNKQIVDMQRELQEQKELEDRQ